MMQKKKRSTRKTSRAAAIFGGGEMGARIRAHDWAGTPLGPMADWPQSLQVAVRILLTSRYAMWMGWGSELTFFCNDAYLPTVGVKRDWVLGAPSRKVWAEIWPDIGPRLEHVLKTGESTWDEGLLLFLERSGYPEETYHTFSYSPLYDDAGAVGGHLCVVAEETERVIGDRRLAVLRELAAQLSSAHTEDDVYAAVERCVGTRAQDLPFILLYLFGTDGNCARLACAAGIAPASGIAPEAIDLYAGAEVWPAHRMLSGTAPSIIVDDLAQRFDTVPTGPWDKPARQAVLVPIAQQGRDRPAGFLVAGINPYRPFDTAYRGFVDLLAGQIAAGLSNARAYAQERNRAEALAEIDRAKTAFFSNASHEFRTPLTLMLGPLRDMLSEPEGLSRKNYELLMLMDRNGLRLLKLVNTLLDFSRIEAGRVQAVYAPTDLAAHTAELASVFRAAVEKAGMRLEIDCPPLPEPVFIDRDMWEKIVLNLISNAFKYTFVGDIRVSLRTQNGAALLTVRDTGTGIPQAELGKLFHRFHRVEGARGRTHEGTGIGLALVHELVKLHGGSVGVESVYGKGSTFTVTLPFGKDHLPADRIGAARTYASTPLGADPFIAEALRWLPDGPAASATAASMAPPLSADVPLHAGGLDAPQPKGKIILADDNADMRGYVGRLLAPYYDVVAVADGQEALRAALEQRPDLVLSDVMMPNLDGFGLLKALRADPRTASTPLIMLSARAGEEAKVEGLTAGVDDYLIKPFTARELLARVGAQVEIARLRRQSLQNEQTLRTEAETLNEVARSLTAERDLQALLQKVTDTATALTAAKFGAFFYNSPNDRGESYVLYTLSGAPREAFEKFGLPRNTALFEPTFRGASVVRIDDVLKDPRYGRNPPHQGMPKGHLPVRSYLASPVVTRAGEVLGGLFCGHPEPGMFSERAERLITSLASQAAIAIDNVQMYQTMQRKEKELQRKNYELSAFVETAAVGLHWVGPDGIILWANEAQMRLLGYDRGEYVGRHIAEFHIDSPVIDDMLARLTRGEKLHQAEARLKCKDGAIKHVLIDSSVLWEDGKFIHSQCFMVDVTERKRAEMAARETHGLLSSVLESIPDVFVSVDRAWRVTYFNATALRLMKKQLDEVVGRVLWDVLPVYKETEIETGLHTAMKERRSLRFELRGPISGRWYETSIYPIENGLSIFGRDIHEQKQAEQELTAVKDELAMQLTDMTRLHELSRRLLSHTSPDDVLQEVLKGVAVIDKTTMGLLSLYDPVQGDLKLKTSLGFKPEFLRFVERVQPGAGACGTCLKEQSTVIVEDVQSDVIFEHYREAARVAGFRAVHSTPLMTRSGKLLGVLSVHFREPHRPSEWEIRLVDLYVHEAVELLEYSHGQKALRDSEERFRRMSESSMIGIVFFSTTGEITDANDAFLNMVGYSREELRDGRIRWDKLTPPEWMERTQAAVDEFVRTGKMTPYEKEYFRRDGSRFWGLFSGARFNDTLEGVTFVTDITERKKMEQALRDSEGQLAAELAMMSRLHELSTRLLRSPDLAATLQEVLDAAIAMHGTHMGTIQLLNPRDQMLEIVAHRGFKADFLDHFRAVGIDDGSACARAMRNGERTVVEDVETDPAYAAHRAVAVAAGYRAVQSTPLASRSGAVLGVLSTHFPQPRRLSESELQILDLYARQAADFIERLQTEEALRTSDARFRALARAVPAIVWTAAPDGTITYANEQWFAFCGLTPEENARDWPELVLHPDDHDRCIAAWTHALQTGEDYEIEVRNRRHDGEYRWFITRAIPARDAVGRVLGWFGTSTDIHDLKSAEATLRDSEARFREMADHAPMMVWVTEPGGACTFLSKSWYDFTGQAHDMGLASGWFEGVHPDERLAMRDTFDRANARREPFRMEYRLRRKDGVYRWVLDVATPRFGPDGRYLGYIGSVIDITDRKQAEEELLNARRLESIGVLAGGIAHDFNNILTAILGNVSLAKLRSTQDPGTIEALSQAEQASVRARELTQQLLTFSKGGAPIKKLGSLAELLREATAFALRGAKVRLALHIADDLWPAIFDAGQMSQVLNNLMINAVQAMPRGGAIVVSAANIFLSAANEHQLPPGDYVKIDVRDQGVGIPPDHINRIFDPYFTTKQTGSGLGLATSYSIIKRHQGAIGVASELNKGTTFTLLLPAAMDEVALPETAAPVLHQGRGRILLMDDEEIVRQVGKSLLEELGYEVQTTADGTEAIACYVTAMKSRRPFDLLILDLTVPGPMGGRECLEKLQTIDPNVSAIVSSGYSTDPVMADFARYGFAGVVAKPYQLHELSEAVFRVLKNRRTQEKAGGGAA